MTPTKLLVGQMLVVFAIIILGVWAATQWAAAMLGHQSQLGQPWFVVGRHPVYHPWSLFPWWYHYEAYAPEVFDKAGALAGASGFAGCGAAIGGSLWRARQRGRVTTYGSARWATLREARRAGLTRDAGVFLGRLGSYYLRHHGPEHVMAFAPTRSGKGVGLVVPTLLSWTGSAVVHDIKGENWQLTAGWRARFSHCLYFDPTDNRSARYNPLLEVRRGPNEVRDVQNIADILVDPEGALERRNHWEKTSHALLVGAILHILYAEEEKTLARVASFLSDPARSFASTLTVMMRTNHLGSDAAPIVHPVVASAARELLNKSENERSGVLSTAMSFLGLYRDPTVAAVTSACDFRIADLVAGKQPCSLYLVIPPSDISRTKPLSRVTPYVVEVDKLGEARSVAPAATSYRPTDPQAAWMLGRFIGWVRGVSLDPVLMREHWLSAYDFVTDRGALALNDYARASNPFEGRGDRTVSVAITSVLRASDRSFQVKWIERAYERGNLVSTSRWTAIVTVVVKTPKSADALRKNPLGLFVDAIDWSREFEPAAGSQPASQAPAAQDAAARPTPERIDQ